VLWQKIIAHIIIIRCVLQGVAMMLTIRLNRDQENAVDLLAKSRGESKSEFLRGLIELLIFNFFLVNFF
jgi:hypothetical protein